MALNPRDFLPVLLPDEVLPILLDPHQNLRARLSEVSGVDSAVLRDMAALFLRLEKCNGAAIAVAANQIGVSTKSFVMDITPPVFEPLWEKLGHGPVGFINARVKTYLTKPILFDKKNRDGQLGEGCLSTPGLKIITERSERIIGTWMDLAGRQIEMELEGLAAVAFQHEADHTEGILTWSRMPDDVLLETKIRWAAIKSGIEENPPPYSFVNTPALHSKLFGNFAAKPEDLYKPSHEPFMRVPLHKPE